MIPVGQAAASKHEASIRGAGSRQKFSGMWNASHILVPHSRKISNLDEIAAPSCHRWNAGMGSIWTFVRKPSNQRLLSWLGGGGAVAAAGIWAVVSYVWPAHQTPTAECLQQGVKIGGNVSGSTVSNTVSGGTATAGACLDTTKK
jgi:hypothetical protein